MSSVVGDVLRRRRRHGLEGIAIGTEAASGDLVLDSIGKDFGGVKALQGLSMRLPAGKLSAIIGPNGAGKTTLFNVITGYTKPDRGRVLFGGRDITGLKPHQVHRLGVTRTFQDLKLFEDLSCLDNLRIASRANAVDAAEQLGLLPIAEEIAGNLPYASQKLTALGRALVSQPKFLLLDEPTSGLDRDAAALMIATVRKLAEMDVGVCLIEHNLDVVRELRPHVLCLHLGRLFAEGNLDELEGREDVDEIFFGTGQEGAVQPSSVTEAIPDQSVAVVETKANKRRREVWGRDEGERALQEEDEEKGRFR